MTEPNRSSAGRGPAAISAILFASLVATLGACEPGDQPGPEYMPDMGHGPAYKAFMPNEATRTGITLQRPVAGTIKRGFKPFHYEKGEAEAIRAGAELTNPFHADEPTLAKGKALYEIYCAVCHGVQGKGDGPISSKIPTPPAYDSARLLTYPPGRIFHIVSMGSGKMPSYAVQLVPAERWQIITYVRSQLQHLPEAAPGTGEGSTLMEKPSDNAPLPTPTTPGAGGTAAAPPAAAGGTVLTGTPATGSAASMAADSAPAAAPPPAAPPAAAAPPATTPPAGSGARP